MSRSIQELRSAAIGAGFEHDPLTTEMLDKLAELETAQRSPHPATVTVPSAKPATAYRVAIGVLGVACLAIAGGLFLSAKENSTLKAQLEATASEVKSREAEIVRIRESNSAALTTATANLAQALASAETVSKSNASAADANQAAVNLYMANFNQIQELLNEAKRLREPEQKKN